MLERRIPEWLRHAPAPSVRGFAILAGIEAVARGILVSVFPLAMYRALQDASVVSEVYPAPLDVFDWRGDVFLWLVSCNFE